jgi:molecular chaperone DnaK
VKLSINANGIVEVSATDKGTGKAQSIRVEGSSNLSKEEIERMKAEAEANADADKKEKERIEKINQADSMAFQTENFLKENGDKIPAEDKPGIESAVEELKKAKDSGDLAAIDSAINALNEKMREEFESELASLKEEGYDIDDVTSDFCEGDCALIQADDNYAYYWQIISCDEL